MSKCNKCEKNEKKGENLFKCNKPAAIQSIDNDFLEVHKNLLDVCRIPLAALIQLIISGSLPANVHFSQIVLTYEIILINKSGECINNVGISDSLAGIALQQGTTTPFVTKLQIIGHPDHIVLASDAQIIESGGQLLNVRESFLPPFSTSKILLNLALSAPDNTICEIRQVQNSVCVDGTIKGKKINTIVATSPIWKTGSDFSFLIGLNIVIGV